MTLTADRGADKMSEPALPDRYVHVDGLDRHEQPQAFIVAHAYRQLLLDLRDGTTDSPSCEHAVRRHDSIELARS